MTYAAELASGRRKYGKGRKYEAEKMTRPRKDVVDYFPHYCVHKSTMFILEQRYGNDGYAFWFKLLEQLGSTEGHFIDCNDQMQWEFLQAKTRIAGDICAEIIGTLCRLKAIDAELWEKRIIWSDNFIKQVAEVYRNRRKPVPAKPGQNGLLGVVIPEPAGLSGVVIPEHRDSEPLSIPDNPQRRGEERREEKRTSSPKSGDAEARAHEYREAEFLDGEIETGEVLNLGKKKKKVSCPQQEIIETYHAICQGLPLVQSWNLDSQKSLAARWNEKKERQDLQWWMNYFTRVTASDFLSGRVKNFMATLNWLIGPKNMEKVLNGTYDNRVKAPIPERLRNNIQAGMEFISGAGVEI